MRLNRCAILFRKLYARVEGSRMLGSMCLRSTFSTLAFVLYESEIDDDADFSVGNRDGSREDAFLVSWILRDR